MALLDVLTIPDAKLKQKCQKVDTVDNSIKKIMKDMLQTMYAEEGVGLAANQVGILKQIIVIDIKEFDKIKRPDDFYPLFLVNPECTYYSDELVSFNEGCLSVPGEKIDVIRPKEIEINYIDQNNEPKILKDNGFLARVIQHEMDHLKGKTILDYVSKLKRDILIKKMIKSSEARL